jgi:hypothetical protein
MTARKKASKRKTAPRTRATTQRRTSKSGNRSGGPIGATMGTTGIRGGSKQALLAARLSEPAGVKIADLTKELNWLPHTVRAALTRLRQQGYTVTRSKSEQDETVYHATPPVTEKKRNRATAKSAG